MCTLHAVIMLCFIFDEESFSKMFLSVSARVIRLRLTLGPSSTFLLLDLLKTYDGLAWRSKFMRVFTCVSAAGAVFLGFCCSRGLDKGRPVASIPLSVGGSPQETPL
jgi:hypothetical protein